MWLTQIIKSIDKKCSHPRHPGVVGVFTGDDIAADKVGGPICGWVVPCRDGSATKEPPHPLLAQGKVRFVGDAVAVVLAETAEQAKSGAELIDVDYEELSPVVDFENAGDGAQIHDEVPNNCYFDWELGDEKATTDALSGAKKIVKLRVRNNRLVPNAMEPRCALAEFDNLDDSYTLHTTSQNPHLTRLVLAAFMFAIPESKLRVIAPDVGGGFGSKIYVYIEEAVCVWASKKVGRPVKWTADRTQAFLTDCHGRDHVNDVQLGLDENNKIVGLRVDTVCNLGRIFISFLSSSAYISSRNSTIGTI